MKHFTSIEWIKIDIANQAGKDKLIYEERIAWVDNIIDTLEEFKEAKKPARYIKAVLALRDAQNNIPIGHLVGLDASASGIALLSVCSRCSVGMMNTGVLNTGKRPSIYALLTDMMGLPGFDIEVAKYALMPFFYSSDKAPLEAFGEHIAVFHREAENVAPHAYRLRNIMTNSWQKFSLAHMWTLPNSSVVYKRVWQTVDTKVSIPNLDNKSFTYRHSVNKGKPKGRSLCADITHSIDGFVVQEMSARCTYDRSVLIHYKTIIEDALEAPYMILDRTTVPSLDLLPNLTIANIGSVSQNFLAQLLELINRTLEMPSFEMVAVHDEFLCHPNYCEALRTNYNRIMWDLYNGNVVHEILAQVTHRLVLPNYPYNPLVANAILDSEYAIS